MKNMIRLFLVLAVLSLACTVELVTPEPTPANSLPTVGAEKPVSIQTPEVANTATAIVPTLSTLLTDVGIVVADDAVKVRDTPEANGIESNGVGTLYKGQVVQQIGSCVTVGMAIWVHHAAGWSVARNSSGIYISGVCE